MTAADWAWLVIYWVVFCLAAGAIDAYREQGRWNKEQTERERLQRLLSQLERREGEKSN